MGDTDPFVEGVENMVRNQREAVEEDNRQRGKVCTKDIQELAVKVKSREPDFILGKWSAEVAKGPNRSIEVTLERPLSSPGQLLFVELNSPTSVFWGKFLVIDEYTLRSTGPFVQEGDSAASGSVGGCYREVSLPTWECRGRRAFAYVLKDIATWSDDLNDDDYDGVVDVEEDIDDDIDPYVLQGPEGPEDPEEERLDVDGDPVVVLPMIKAFKNGHPASREDHKKLSGIVDHLIGCYGLEVMKFIAGVIKNRSDSPKVFDVDVVQCARCGRKHKQLRFSRFADNPITVESDGGFYCELTYWAICPNAAEPVLLDVVEGEDPDGTHTL